MATSYISSEYTEFDTRFVDVTPPGIIMRLVQTTLRLDYDTVSLHVRNSRITVRVHLSDVQTTETRTEKTEFKTLSMCYDRNRIILPIVTPSETVLSFLETAATSAVSRSSLRDNLLISCIFAYQLRKQSVELLKCFVRVWKRKSCGKS